VSDFIRIWPTLCYRIYKKKMHHNEVFVVGMSQTWESHKKVDLLMETGF